MVKISEYVHLSGPTEQESSMSNEAFEWVLLDVETADPRNRASICEVGAILMRGDNIQATYTTLVDPECDFYYQNSKVHGLKATDVVGAPKLGQVLVDICDLLRGRLWISQSNFDLGAIKKAMGLPDYNQLDTEWKDSIAIFKSIWPEKSKRNGGAGYSLKVLAEEFAIDFQHHHAIEDARAVLQLLEKAALDINLPLIEIIKTYPKNKPHKRVSSAGEKITYEVGNGSLNDEFLCVTGTFSVEQKELKQMAAEAGAEVQAGVTKKTTILVVGDLSGNGDTSSKEKKAIKALEDGQAITILGESDFIESLKQL